MPRSSAFSVTRATGAAQTARTAREAASAQAAMDKFNRIQTLGIPVMPSCENCGRGGRICCIKLDEGVLKCGECFRMHRNCNRKNWAPPDQGQQAEGYDQVENDDQGENVVIGLDEQSDVESMRFASAELDDGIEETIQNRDDNDIVASVEQTIASADYSDSFAAALRRSAGLSSSPIAQKQMINKLAARKPLPAEPHPFGPLPKRFLPSKPLTQKPFSDKPLDPEKLSLRPRENIYNNLMIMPNDMEIGGFDKDQSHRQVVDLRAGRYPIFQVKVDGNVMNAALLLPKAGSNVYRGGIEEEDHEADVARRKRLRSAEDWDDEGEGHPGNKRRLTSSEENDQEM